MNLPDEKREALAEVANAHHLQGDTARQLDAAGQCSCGEKLYEIGGTASAYLEVHRRLLARHAAHLADALAPLLAGWLAEAWDEGMRWGQLHWATNYGINGREAENPYRADAAETTGGGA